MTKSKSQNNPNIIWSFFSSVKLTIVLLVILASVSIFGTVVPQQEGAVEFARSLSPQVLRIYSALDLFDMYHSPWFRLIMGFLALNLIICSLDRFPGAIKRFRALPRPDRDKPFKNLPTQYTFRVKASVNDTSSSVARLLRGPRDPRWQAGVCCLATARDGHEYRRRRSQPGPAGDVRREL